MDELYRDVKKAISLTNGELVIGNHDSITLFGASAQSKLRDNINTVSRIVIHESNNIESIISEVVSNLEQLQDQKKGFFSKRESIGKLQRRYEGALEYLDQITDLFQVHKIQLIKESKTLELIYDSINDCYNELDSCIEYGHHFLQEYSTLSTNDNSLWFNRLKSRIDDLNISKTLALQNIIQIKLLCENDLLLIDKISHVISNVISLWRTQVTSQFALRKKDEHSKIYSSLDKKSKLVISYDVLYSLNDMLIFQLSDIATSENEDNKLRKPFIIDNRVIKN